MPEQSPPAPLVGTMFAKSAVVIRYIKDATFQESARPANGDIEEVKRAFLAGSGSVRLGDWVIVVGSADTINLHTKIYQSPEFEEVVAATREISRKHPKGADITSPSRLYVCCARDVR